MLSKEGRRSKRTLPSNLIVNDDSILQLWAVASCDTQDGLKVAPLDFYLSLANRPTCQSLRLA